MWPEKFSHMVKKHAKTKWSYLVILWSLSFQIGGSRGHRIQVVIFDTFLNYCVPNLKMGQKEIGHFEPMVVSWTFIEY